MAYYPPGRQQYPNGGTPLGSGSGTPVPLGSMGSIGQGYVISQQGTAVGGFDPMSVSSVSYSAHPAHPVSTTPTALQQQQYQQQQPFQQQQQQQQHVYQQPQSMVSQQPQYQSQQPTTQPYQQPYQMQTPSQQQLQYQQQIPSSMHLQTQILPQQHQQQQPQPHQQVYIASHSLVPQSQSQPLAYSQHGLAQAQAYLQSQVSQSQSMGQVPYMASQTDHQQQQQQQQHQLQTQQLQQQLQQQQLQQQQLQQNIQAQQAQVQQQRNQILGSTTMASHSLQSHVPSTVHQQHQQQLQLQLQQQQQHQQQQLQQQQQQQRIQAQNQHAINDSVRDARNTVPIEVVTNPQTSTLQLAEFASVMVYTLWHTRPNINGASSNAYNVVPHRISVPATAGPAFKKFCLKVLSATQLSSSVILLSLKYIQKLLKNNPSIHGQQGSEFRLFTVSLMLANKFLDDNTFTNKTWSQVTGISVKEINVMEMEFLNQVQFSLFVSEAEYLDWLHSLETWLKQQGQGQA
ncbi:hypothetical protein BGZ67_009428 [Mortierella alpina]|nr:hypothetical protein BGZ67_009428 [Mortierella alpina]